MCIFTTVIILLSQDQQKTKKTTKTFRLSIHLFLEKINK